MITVSSLTRPDQAPEVRSGRILVASVDVEWTKNYRIRNGIWHARPEMVQKHGSVSTDSAAPWGWPRPGSCSALRAHRE